MNRNPTNKKPIIHRSIRIERIKHILFIIKNIKPIIQISTDPNNENIANVKITNSDGKVSTIKMYTLSEAAVDEIRQIKNNLNNPNRSVVLKTAIKRIKTINSILLKI